MFSRDKNNVKNDNLNKFKEVSIISNKKTSKNAVENKNRSW